MTEGTANSECDDTAEDGLRTLTLGDLASEVTNKSARATNEEKRSGWERLASLITELQASPIETGDIGWLLKQKWSLAKVSAQGFRGILNVEPLDVSFDPRPGVTVLHGANGAGKSSLTDAIVASLTGTVRSTGGTGGQAPLWEPVVLGRGAPVAKAEVVLASGSARLAFRYAQDAPSGTTHWTCVVKRDGKTAGVALGDRWVSAVANHNPVFAYANIERRTQDARSLSRYFEDLLALGGSFDLLRSRVDQRSRVAREAFETWRRALQSAEQVIARIDAEEHDPQLPDVAALRFPQIGDSVDAWIDEHGLAVSGEVHPEIEPEFIERITDNATRMVAELDQYRAQAGFLGQALAHELESLLRTADKLNDPPRDCPVCLSPDVDWHSALRTTVDKLGVLRSAKASAGTVLAALRADCDQVLAPLLGRLTEASPDTTAEGEARVGLGHYTAFDAMLSAGGLQLSPDLQDTARELAIWIASDGGQETIRLGIERSRREFRWILRRRQAIEDFLSVWRQYQPQGAEWPLWREAARCVEDLRKSLRQSRTKSLEVATDTKLDALLDDVGLTVRRLRVLDTKAELTLTDSSGEDVDLGMLSAGQRNAMLLAPLMAAAEAGPFRFLVLDDPVHAFDEMRVDRLAKAIGELAVSRRVIVLTHDERLREHLLATPGPSNSHVVHREPTTGEVTIQDSTDSWDILLSDARSVLASGRPVPGTTLSLTNTVRGFCRLALDAAIRAYVIRFAVIAGRPWDSDLAQLDSKNTTKERLEVASRLGDASEVISATTGVASYLDGWNRAAHGNTPTTEATDEEIVAALAACKELAHG